ncbi:MAG: hypothetical protein N3G21_10165 [Candidatus Hydrogenedentes bacterium]|nr:hypothetical protein [Candidatus Hydrogenedentota bacterium]
MAMLFIIFTLAFMNINSANIFNLPKEINEWKLEANTPERFTPETLYDYIDGNAEVYKSLGVNEVFVYRYHNLDKSDKEEIIVDIFDMNSSSSAYGAYHNDIRDLPSADIGAESEIMSNSLTFWKDKYFVVITGIGESENIKQTIIAIGKYIDSKIPNKGDPPHIINLLPKEGLISSQIHYFKNYDLLKVRFYLSEEDPFQLKDGCEGIVARYKLPEKSEDFLIFIISYTSEKDTTNALSKLKELCSVTTEDQGFTKSLSKRNSLFFSMKNYLVLFLDFKDRNIVKKYKQEIIALSNKRST